MSFWGGGVHVILGELQVILGELHVILGGGGCMSFCELHVNIIFPSASDSDQNLILYQYQPEREYLQSSLPPRYLRAVKSAMSS